MDVVGEVNVIVRRAQRAGGTATSRLLSVCEAVRAISDIDATDPITFRYQEYVIVPGLSLHLTREAEILERIRGLEIAAAPELVALVPLAQGEEVLISRYWACPGEKLAPVNSTTAPFWEEATRRLRRELERLADHGMMHPYARGFHHWLVASQTGTLVLNGWSALRPCSREDSNDLLKKVDWLLSNRR